MMYDVLVSIINSPSKNPKVGQWGYLINSDSKEGTKETALKYARAKADKPYSRYKKCSFEVKEEDIVAKPDW